MADISPYTEEIQNAVYGEEVRSSLINALNAVNDDNNSYAQIKQDILDAKDDIDETVAEFEQTVSDAETTYNNLTTATVAGNTARTNLTNATTTANTAKTNLTNATTTANTARTNLESATTAANTATTTANTARTNLESATTTANTAKTNLTNATTTANTAKTNLENTTSTASTLKTNLETTITNAGTAKTQLESVITSAGTAKSELSATITNAGTAESSLEDTITDAGTAYNSLNAENASAASNLADLRSENFNAQKILTGVVNIEAYLGMITDLPGLCADFENKTFTRIAGASGKTAGTDFDAFPTYAGIKNCIVADDGTILAYYGDSAYTETGALVEAVTIDDTTYPIGTACQVMTYYPKFYYLVAPINYEAQSTGIGYHLRKANYYISDKARTGFKVHPAFYDANGNETDYVLVSTYEGCLYDTSAGEYITDESQVMNTSEDKFSSIAGARPASGLTQNLTRPAVETLCNNRGTGWHSLGIKTASMIQLLMVIEMGAFNMQSAIGQGVVSITDNSSCSCASFTGSTASIGNATGNATSTNDYSGTAQTTSGKLAVRYRGLENFWGNIWKIVQGINFWGDGTMAGGQPYICTDYEYAESKNSDNYEGAGFTLTNASGYVSAFGYSTKYDWLFLPSECSGNTSLPVGDYSYVTPNLNAYRVAFLGGDWRYGAMNGPFYWSASDAVGRRYRHIGGRCVYIPTASVS